MITKWQQYQVPKYPGATEGQFTQLGQTAVQNGGSIVFSSEDSPEKVLAYYRAALPFLGWKEIGANSGHASFRTSKASLTITVSDNNGVTSIMMILGDV